MDTHSIGGMIKILSETIGQKTNANCKEFNLTMQQLKILRFLKLREGKMITSQRDIQEYMRISHPTTVNMIRLLREKGFIQTTTSQKDKRMRIVSLTGQEDEFFQNIMQYRDAVEQVLVRGLTEKEQDQLRSYLKHIYKNICEFDKADLQGGKRDI